MNQQYEKKLCNYKLKSTKLCTNTGCDMCYKKSFASQEKCRFWSEKNLLTPRHVFKGTENRYIFNCGECNHEFTASLNNILTANSWCPFCKNKKLCDSESCITCEQKSFRSSSRLKNWDIEKNIVSPRQVFKSSDDIFWFICDDCDHKFQASPSSVAYRWCPFCANKKLCSDDDCIICLEKSFLSNPRAINWSEKNSLKPRQVFKSSGNKYIFNCNTCYHDFTSRLTDITNKGSWCCFCANQSLCNDDNCKICYEKSFESIGKSKLWVCEKNKMKPRQVFKYCNKKFWFKCICGYEFQKRLNDISSKDSWCKKCASSRSEECAREILEKLTRVKWPSVRPFWLKNIESGRNLEMDGWCEELNLGFEYQGEQHFKYIPHFHKTLGNFHKMQERDQIKYELSIRMKKPYIQIPYHYSYKNIDEMRLFLIHQLASHDISSIDKHTIIPSLSLDNKRKITDGDDDRVTRRARVTDDAPEHPELNHILLDDI